MDRQPSGRRASSRPPRGGGGHERFSRREGSRPNDYGPDDYRPLEYIEPDALGYQRRPESWTPYQPREQRGGSPERPGRGPRLGLVLLALGAVGLGAYVMYQRMPLAPQDDRIAAAPTPTPPPPAPRPVPASVRPATDAVMRALVGGSLDLAVWVGDELDGDVPNAVVRFSIERGTGALDPEVARTDREGVARASLLLPPRPGEIVVEAAVQGSALEPVRFTVDAGTGPPVRVMPVQGDHQEADVDSPLPGPVVVRVADELDNPVLGAEVFFEVVSGGGTIAPARLLTDSLGRASALWRLGTTPGTQLASARAPDVGGPVTFTATAHGARASRVPPAPRPQEPAGTPAAVEPEWAGQDTRQPARPGAGDFGAAGRRAAGRRAVTVVRRDFSVGGTHACRISGGTVTCRGANDRGQSAGAAAGVMAVAAGMAHVCALTADGTASCWGGNESGQLGDGSRQDSPTPTPVATELRFSMLAAGASHTCGLTSWGAAACWGQNLSGQLGDGTRGDRSEPVTVAGAMFEQVVAGWSHTCGVTVEGELFCWGSNAEGQLGEGTGLDRLVPRWITGSVEAVVAGSAHTCAIRSGRVVCWGDNSFGQLGDGTTESHELPMLTELPGRPVGLAAGAVHTCALLEGGAAYCWGQNRHGQLGTGTTMDAASPSAVSGGLSFAELSAGGGVTCGLTTDGARYCWGLNQSGQLGDGSRTSRSAPAPVGR